MQQLNEFDNTLHFILADLLLLIKIIFPRRHGKINLITDWHFDNRIILVTVFIRYKLLNKNKRKYLKKERTIK